MDLRKPKSHFSIAEISGSISLIIRGEHDIQSTSITREMTT